MQKEVSDKVVIILVVVAVVVSFMGTYLVYINSNNIPIGQTIIINRQDKSVDSGKVGVEVVSPETSETSEAR